MLQGVPGRGGVFAAHVQDSKAVVEALLVPEVHGPHPSVSVTSPGDRPKTRRCSTRSAGCTCHINDRKRAGLSALLDVGVVGLDAVLSGGDGGAVLVGAASAGLGVSGAHSTEPGDG